MLCRRRRERRRRRATQRTFARHRAGTQRFVLPRLPMRGGVYIAHAHLRVASMLHATHGGVVGFIDGRLVVVVAAQLMEQRHVGLGQLGKLIEQLTPVGTLFGIFVPTTQHHFIQKFRTIYWTRHTKTLSDLHHGVVRVEARVRFDAVRHHLPQHDAKRPHVARHRVAIEAQHFGRTPLDRPFFHFRRVEIVHAADARQAKVGHFRRELAVRLFRTDENVARRQVAVNDAVVVQVQHARQHVLRNAEQLQQADAPMHVVAQQTQQRAVLEQFHDEPQTDGRLGPTHAVHRHNGWMRRQRHEQLRFGEQFDDVGSRRLLALHRLDGHGNHFAPHAFVHVTERAATKHVANHQLVFRDQRLFIVGIRVDLIVVGEESVHILIVDVGEIVGRQRRYSVSLVLSIALFEPEFNEFARVEQCRAAFRRQQTMFDEAFHRRLHVELGAEVFVNVLFGFQ
mmetsp:Transcript_16486/g.28309  ORF Transcript_16486/g.28309 Transcript_16486/m.28309 type:complete len:453 (+) Transcript_16486:1311-2669(+)